MAGFFSRLKSTKQEWSHLVQEFPSKIKSEAAYTAKLEGMEIKGNKVTKLLEEFAFEKHPVMYLHIPGNFYEEFREYQISEVKKETIHVLNISTDTAIEVFTDLMPDIFDAAIYFCVLAY